MATREELELVQASAEGDLGRIRELIRRGANVNSILENGATPLLAAAIAGQTEAVRLILAQGGDVQRRYQDDATVLMLAATQGHAGTDPLPAVFEPLRG